MALLSLKNAKGCVFWEADKLVKVEIRHHIHKGNDPGDGVTVDLRILKYYTDFRSEVRHLRPANNG